jgi:hypothetical protein
MMVERAISGTIIGLKYTTLMMLNKEYMLACNSTFKLVYQSLVDSVMKYGRLRFDLPQL